MVSRAFGVNATEDAKPNTANIPAVELLPRRRRVVATEDLFRDRGVDRTLAAKVPVFILGLFFPSN